MTNEIGQEPAKSKSSHGKSQESETENKLESSKPENKMFALGLAVSYLMNKKAFAKQPFGVWSKVLVGQLNRGHYLFIHRGQKIVGFAGWSVTNKKRAEDWLADRADIPYDESKEGDCFVFNAWSADDFRAHRFLLDQMRPAFATCEVIYYKRAYKDGRTRPVRLTVNEFVASHIDRKQGSSGTDSGD